MYLFSLASACLVSLASGSTHMLATGSLAFRTLSTTSSSVAKLLGLGSFNTGSFSKLAYATFVCPRLLTSLSYSYLRSIFYFYLLGQNFPKLRLGR